MTFPVERAGALDAPWTGPAAAVLEALDTTADGLSSEEAAERLGKYGPNHLPRKAPPSLVEVVIRQFRSPLIVVLAIAAGVSASIGAMTDAGFIVAVLVLNATIGALQEWRAERSSFALQSLVRTTATVSRDTVTMDVDASDLVPGDVVWLESGVRVPADVRLLRARGLEIDESLLTGESTPVHKQAEGADTHKAPIGERTRMAFAGSTVARGRAKAVVVHTGLDTQVGRLSRALTGRLGGKPPLQIRLERFTRAVATTVLVGAALVATIGVASGTYAVLDMFLFAVAMAVSAIPEGLPVALTVALAVAARRMAQRGVIVRRLSAVEGLGSCTLIASDKTGTLTANELTVRIAQLPDGTTLDVTGVGYDPASGGIVDRERAPVSHGEHPALDSLLSAAVLCNEASLHQREGAWHYRGDPTDVALLSFGLKGGLSRERALDADPLVDQIPFEPEHKYALTVHGEEGREARQVIVKGAPEAVLAMCTLDRAREARALADAQTLAQRGFRVLAFAVGHGHLKEAPPTGLSFVGFLGMVDPIRSGVAESIARCQRAGIRVLMVTGDHPAAALTISRELGLTSEDREVVTGDELERSDAEQQIEMLRRGRVFARVAPTQKLTIVEAAQAGGDFVAVTGDGVNDAPALRAANIGVAMGRSGTDVAREAAELVLSDDNFATLVAGVEEGRIAYDNVRKVIFLLVSTGAAEIVMVLASLVAGLPLPLLPAQLLWLNLVTNGIQDVALAFEPKERDVLTRPPRPPRERIFNRLMLERTVLSAVVMGLTGFASFQFMITRGWSLDAARNHLLLLMVLFEIIHIGNCRSEIRSMLVLPPHRSPILLLGTLVALAVHVLALYVPAGRALIGTAPVGVVAWLALLALALSVAVVMELHKLTWRIRHRMASSEDSFPTT